jgi:ferredoxin-NADP reductase
MAFGKLKFVSGRDECTDVRVLDFTFSEGEPFSYDAGQYANLHAPEGAPVSGGKSYTIVSRSDAETMQFAIRRRGPFSSFLCDLSVGDEVLVDGPHGFFTLPDAESVVCLAAGIGVAPFLSWARASRAPTQQSLYIGMSNTALTHAPFLEELSTRAAESGGTLSVESFLTRGDAAEANAAAPRRQNITHRVGRMTTPEHQAYLSELIRSRPGAAVAICGGSSFTLDLWRFAKSIGVPDDHIFTEAFF